MFGPPGRILATGERVPILWAAGNGGGGGGNGLIVAGVPVGAILWLTGACAGPVDEGRDVGEADLLTP